MGHTADPEPLLDDETVQGAWMFPQAGEEPGLEEESPAFAATVEEPRKERTPRLDWAGLLRRTFALDVFACLRCGGRRSVVTDVMAYA